MTTLTSVPRRRVIAWASWDWGTSAFSALITTFVFARYIVSDSFIDPAVVAAYEAAGGAGSGGAAETAYLAAQADLTSAVGWVLALGGLVVALTAPVIGQRADAAGKRKRWLAVTTGIVVLVCFALYFVEPTPDFFLLGIVLLAVGTVTYEIANVNYNAMLLDVSTPNNIGRVSGFGWGAGYIGTIVVLILALAGFVLVEPFWFGVSGDNAQNLRVIFVLAGVWAAVFALPLFLVVPEVAGGAAKLSIIESYRKVIGDFVRLYRESRLTFSFLIASAVFRDGLAAIFAFGGILAGTVFGFSDTGVILFAVAANLVAGIGVLIGGLFDDRFGPQRVIIAALIGLIVSGLALFVLRDLGAIAFWTFGLALTLFVGPAQAASRSFLARLTPESKAGEIFGLYATTGRAVSFVAPALFAIFVSTFGAPAFGILGIVLVLAVGLALMWPIARAANRAQALN